jgi:hypothetical protein
MNRLASIVWSFFIIGLIVYTLFDMKSCLNKQVQQADENDRLRTACNNHCYPHPGEYLFFSKLCICDEKLKGIKIE